MKARRAKPRSTGEEVEDGLVWHDTGKIIGTVDGIIQPNTNPQVQK
jgi:hypothetical protein